MGTDVSVIVVRVFKCRVVLILEMGMLCFETSVANYQSALCNIAEDRRSQSENVSRRKRWCGFLCYQSVRAVATCRTTAIGLCLYRLRKMRRESMSQGLRMTAWALTSQSSSKVGRSPAYPLAPELYFLISAHMYIKCE